MTSLAAFKELNPVFQVLASIGILVTASYIHRVARFLASYLFGGIPLSKFGANKGAWAVVTGATAGIGYEFSIQLAQKGFNVLLISRDATKLEIARTEVQKKAPQAEIKAYALDLEQASPADFATLGAELKQYDIGVLVNNAGRSHAYPEYFHLQPDEEVEGIVKINVGALVALTRLVVPGMVERHRGLILNIGSFSSYVPSPLLSVYTGSKAFVNGFSQALGSELEDKGITVSCINTYYVVSALSKIRKPNFFTPLPAAYVRSVLSHIGTPVGAVGGMPYLSTPYITHALAQFFIDHVFSWPIWFWYNKRVHLDIRKRALRKRAREAKAQ